MTSYQALLEDPPKSVAWADIVEIDDLDERRSCIDCLYINTLGVNDGFVGWSPNDDPPSRPETLAWLWFIRPDLGTEIAADAPPELKNLISKHQSGRMDEWWQEMTK